MDLYEEAEYHERRKAKGGRGKGGRGARQDGAIDDLPANEPPKDGMTRAEFKEWKLTQIELQKVGCWLHGFTLFLRFVLQKGDWSLRQNRKPQPLFFISVHHLVPTVCF